MVQKRKSQNNIYNKLIGCLTKNGKKSISQQIVFEVIEEVSSFLKIKSVDLIKIIVTRLGTIVELKTVRLRKNIFKVPTPVHSSRRNYLIIKNLLDVINSNSSNQSIKKRLVQEILNIVNFKGSKILSFRANTIKDAFKNKSNIHYRW